MISLRAASPDDIPAVLTFWNEATAEPSSTDDAEGVGALLDRSPGSLLLALDAEKIVGTIVAGFDGWRAALYRLAVAPSHRRQGIATVLVAEAEQHLRDQGVRRMHLIVSRAGGAAAEEFWLSAQYTPTDQLRMVKDLG